MPQAAHLHTSTGRAAMLELVKRKGPAQVFRVSIENLHTATVVMYAGRSSALWRCACKAVCHDKWQMIEHVYRVHYPARCREQLTTHRPYLTKQEPLVPLPAPQRYLPLGDARRRYYDAVRHEEISRRQALKRQGIFPESRATTRRAAGLSSPRKPRKDKGVARVS